MNDQEVNTLVGHLFRREAGKMAAVLTKLLGFDNLEAAQDIVQDTLLQAITVWKYKGVPENPEAWLYTVAKRKAIDAIRQSKVREHAQEEISRALKSEWTLSPTIHALFEKDEIEDAQLRMIFACCHPAIPYESQIALTLKTLCGLSISEIAKSFLTNDETITKRLYRAREKIRAEKIDLEFPGVKEIPLRLSAVIDTLYLLFNEGYNSSQPDTLIRSDLCEEAMRLCILLTRNPSTNNPKTNALLSLMCFHASRMDGRLDSNGEIILLKNQDRSKWNPELIAKGIEFLNIASEEDDLNEYQIEAAIAAFHASAKSFAQTNWKEIHSLYEALSRVKSGVIVELNKAIALGYATSAQNGLDALLKIEELSGNHLYHSALGDFYVSLKDYTNATREYQRAKANTSSKAELSLLESKLGMIKTDSDPRSV
jgi:RNA polymerase sigma factor (sigma-70 family)